MPVWLASLECWAMRIDKYTQKMQEALQSAQDLAAQYNHQEIANEHFLLALLQQPDGIARPLLDQMQVPVDQLQQQFRQRQTPPAHHLIERIAEG